MFKKSIAVFVASLLLSACGATSDIKTADVDTKKEKIAKCMKENKEHKEDCVSKESVARTGLVCRNEMVTGSRLPKRICTTAEQRRREAEASQGMVDHMQKRGFTSTSR
ncbi:hypothetical protein [Alteromonas sp. a30]|uniref:hypothetical protein n=1 Tax=Alteromonas sp. a30 TaxID=2730917 RepID=UPI0022829AE6|nr:hypothetical protein [Alteromonas sp. a30]MCY7295957.1 hypothetical protein [Alteromonas sp. a30]